ncbi:hypothetical protein ACFVT5_42795 [Streptomyces sp. NPDC058001]|uniref:hypothetical protein n=1 Tax=Streptomyces sp. NPDC058001 TaxID=3346300 RepID=UPI0036E8C971
MEATADEPEGGIADGSRALARVLSIGDGQGVVQDSQCRAGLTTNTEEAAA